MEGVYQFSSCIKIIYTQVAQKAELSREKESAKMLNFF